MEGAGSAGLWGFSPAMDLLALGPSNNEEKKPGDPDANFLIMGARDARHIIKTIALVGRHKDFTSNLNFYVYEEQAPMVARTMLLLALFLERNPDVGDLEQAQLFLEVFGNINVREKTYEIVKNYATQLILLLCDCEGSLAPLFDFSPLKSRERDDLEVVFKFWRDDVKKTYDIEKLWDIRLRSFYGVRYGMRENAADWDYHMKLIKERTIIHKKEFYRWRTLGLAYEVRDCTYDKPNRTTATIDVMKQDGVKVSKWGYFNDIVTGPFIPYGVETEKEELLKKENDIHKYPSCEVAQFNIKSYLEEYKGNFPTLESLLSRVKIHVIPPAVDPAAPLLKLAKKRIAFSAVFLGNSCAQHVSKIPSQSLRSYTTVAFETARYMMDLKAEQVSAFQAKLVEVAGTAGFLPVEGYDSKKNVDCVCMKWDGFGEGKVAEVEAATAMLEKLL
ncbi:hypothetical protein BC830DRAFT_394687 [Chytriomyces sp. MP71]|nr:hypothetical protein BC830DRAFT_394687 [Chytriomyces sp. MP71]